MTASKSEKARARLAEAEAWERLAKWVAQPSSKPGRVRVYLCHRLRNAIDCEAPKRANAVLYLNPGLEELPRKFAPLDTLRHMQARLGRHLRVARSGGVLDERVWWWENALESIPVRRELQNHPRVIFCLLMALECREEAK